MRKKFALILLTGAMALTLASAHAAWADETGNMVSFRGGWAHLSTDRGGQAFVDTFNANGNDTANANKSGYYVGGALDLVLSKDVWGMLSQTWALGEIGVEFKRWNTNNNAVQAVPAVAAGFINRGVTVTMLTVDIAPKIKFMEGSRLRPWIIPVGLDFHVISPPSNATTVLDVGAQFGAGAEYRIYKAFHLGVDGRWHWASNQTGTANSFGTVGAYLGIAF